MMVLSLNYKMLILTLEDSHSFSWNDALLYLQFILELKLKIIQDFFYVHDHQIVCQA